MLSERENSIKLISKFKMEAITPLNHLNDLDIQTKVESLVGKDTSRIVDIEQKSWFEQQEILMVNGFPVSLGSHEGVQIKHYIQNGQCFPPQLLSSILKRAGVLVDPGFEFEIESSETRSITRTEEKLELRDESGLVLDGIVTASEDRLGSGSESPGLWDLGSVNSIKTFGKRRENDQSSNNFEMRRKYKLGSVESAGSSLSSCCSSSESDESILSSSPSSVFYQSFPSPRNIQSPSIFGTVAASSAEALPYPKPHHHHRKTLPQTPITGSGSQSLIDESRQNTAAALDRLSSLSSESSSSSSTSSSDEKMLLAGPETIVTTTVVKPCDWDNALVYQDTTLVSGTLDALIQHLVPTQSYYPDRAYVFAFLLSSRLYIKPHELLGRVFRLAVATTQHSNKIHTSKELKIISHVVQLLGEWAELFPYDFRDERMMAHVRSITQKCIAVNPTIRQDVSQLLTSLLSRLTSLERYENFLQRINTEAALGEPITAPSILTICPNARTLAQQLTHIELDRLSHIGPEEFVQAFAKDTSQVETKYKDLKKTRNLESYVQWFNRLSYYVATEICKMPKKKSRVRIIEYWIEAAKECFNIGNFNSLMAVIAGLNMSPVSRLKKTWHKVSSAQLSILEHQMDPSSNFSSYRSTLKAAVWRSTGTADERQRIVIPFFSLLVKDLYFLNEACASKLPSGHINVDKFWQLAKQVTEVIAWQQVTCPYSKIQTLINSLQTAPIFSETALCLSSYECEAADNAQEKERLKYLRNEGNAKKLFSGSTEKEDLK